MLKDAFWLMRRQYFSSVLWPAVTFGIYAVYGAVAGILTSSWPFESDRSNHLLSDLLVISFMASSGFVFSKVYWSSYWKTNAFFSMLAALRALPIPVETLALSRNLQILLISPVNTLFFFLGFWLAGDWLRSLEPGVQLTYVLFWFVFGNLLSCFFVLMEWGTSGKWYLLATLAVIGVSWLVLIALLIATGRSLSDNLADLFPQAPGLWTVAFAAATAVAHTLTHRLLKTILRRRDFA